MPWRSAWSLVGLLSIATGCGTRAAAPRDASSLGSRTVCGWDADEDGLIIGPDVEARVAPGRRVIVLRPTAEARFADLMRALGPAEASMVRVKLAVDGDALVPITLPHRPAVVPRPEVSESTIVGHRKITRPKGAPRDRLADLRIDEGRVTVFVENDKPGGRAMAPADLEAHLRDVEPPVGVFTLGASDETPWPVLREVLIAAACFDRGPGEEPHEVLVR